MPNSFFERLASSLKLGSEDDQEFELEEEDAPEKFSDNGKPLDEDAEKEDEDADPAEEKEEGEEEEEENAELSPGTEGDLADEGEENEETINELAFEESPTYETRLANAPVKTASRTIKSAKEKKQHRGKMGLGGGTLEEADNSEGQLAIDVYQTENDIIIKSTIAGVSPEELDVTVTNDAVTIRGTRKKDEEVSGENYYYQECYWGSFSRSVILPVEIDSDKAKATFKNSILTIRLPKLEKNKE